MRLPMTHLILIRQCMHGFYALLAFRFSDGNKEFNPLERPRKTTKEN